MNFIPFVIDKSYDSERSYDIYSKLLEDRIVFIGDEIDSSVANSVIAQLLWLDQQDHTRDICLYINSPGGSIQDGLAIYDTMTYVKADIRTVCIGEAASMAAILLAGGAKGKRISLPNSRIMIHQPRQTFSRTTQTVTEQQINLKVIKDMKLQLTKILAERTGKPIKKILKDCELDKWFNATDALNYGLIDEVVKHKP